MSLVTIIRLCLTIVNMLMQRASDKQQQEIGSDRVTKNNLANILVRVKTGKRIDAGSEHYDDAAVDRILRDHFRASDGGE